MPIAQRPASLDPPLHERAQPGGAPGATCPDSYYCTSAILVYDYTCYTLYIIYVYIYMYTYVYIHIHTYVCIYIYIEREIYREREREIEREIVCSRAGTAT